MYEANLFVYTERHAALHYMATLLQARAVVAAAPKFGAPKHDEPRARLPVRPAGELCRRRLDGILSAGF